MSRELEKTYDPKKIEKKLYDKWCENKYFHAEVDRSRKPFTTVMPPPNITGKLHMGHALDNTLQDILIRYKRMEGYNALWIPGTDHAAISTEVKVTNQLKEEGIDKKELGREGFLKRTWQWKEEYAGTIENQLKQLGISCDWDRERFTMDEGCSKAVEEVFINLPDRGYGPFPRDRDHASGDDAGGYCYCGAPGRREISGYHRKECDPSAGRTRDPDRGRLLCG